MLVVHNEVMEYFYTAKKTLSACNLSYSQAGLQTDLGNQLLAGNS